MSDSFSTTSYGSESYNNGPTSSPFIDPNGSSICPEGTSCSYAIQAVVGTSTSLWSSWVAVTDIGAPTLQSATYNNSGIALSFVAPTLSAGQTITSYNYEISLDGGTTVSDSFSTTSYGSESYNNGPTSSPFIDPNGSSICPEGTSCSYAIQAVVGTSTSLWASWVAVTDIGAPTLQSATYNNSGIALSFVAPMFSAGQTITSYNYEISLDGGTTVSDSFSTTSYGSESYNNGPTSSPFIDPNGPSICPEGTSCSYAIQAVVGTSTSLWSSWVAVTSFGGAPTLQSATYNNSGIALSFVAPTLSAGLTITSYNYEISLDGGTTVSDSFSTTSYGSESYNNGPTSSPFIDPNGPGICPEGTSCSYAIQAVVADGTYTSAWSSWVSVTSFGGAPTLQSATYNNSGIALSFVAPTLSAGLTITSYNYEISLDGGTTVSDSFSTTSYGSESYNNGPTSSPFIDPNGSSICPEGTSCSYAIQAVVGTSTSLWSSWVAVTDIGAPTLQSATYNNSGIALSFVAPTLSAGQTITSYNYEISLDGGTTVSDSFSTTSYGSESYNNGPTSSPFIDPNGSSICPEGTSCSYAIQAVVGTSTSLLVLLGRGDGHRRSHSPERDLQQQRDRS